MAFTQTEYAFVQAANALAQQLADEAFHMNQIAEQQALAGDLFQAANAVTQAQIGSAKARRISDFMIAYLSEFYPEIRAKLEANDVRQ